MGRRHASAGVRDRRSDRDKGDRRYRRSRLRGALEAVYPVAGDREAVPSIPTTLGAINRAPTCGNRLVGASFMAPGARHPVSRAHSSRPYVRGRSGRHSWRPAPGLVGAINRAPTCGNRLVGASFMAPGARHPVSWARSIAPLRAGSVRASFMAHGTRSRGRDQSRPDMWEPVGRGVIHGAQRARHPVSRAR